MNGRVIWTRSVGVTSGFLKREVCFRRLCSLFNRTYDRRDPKQHCTI